MDIATLQRLCARTWPGLEQDRLGEWELRAAGGFTGRANSALPIGDPGMVLDAALRHVGRWYRARGLPPRLQVPAALEDGSRISRAAGIAEVCDAEGWAAEPWTLMMVRDAGGGVQPGTLQWNWADEPDEAWLDLYHYRGSQLPARARRVITAAPAEWSPAEWCTDSGERVAP